MVVLGAGALPLVDVEDGGFSVLRRLASLGRRGGIVVLSSPAWFVTVPPTFRCGGTAVLKSLGTEPAVGVAVGGLVPGVLCCEMGVLGCDVGVVIAGLAPGTFGTGIGVADVFGGFEVEDLDGNADALPCALGRESAAVLVKTGNALIIVEVEGLLAEETVSSPLIAMLGVSDVRRFFGLWDSGAGMVLGVSSSPLTTIESPEVESGIRGRLLRPATEPTVIAFDLAAGSSEGTVFFNARDAGGGEEMRILENAALEGVFSAL